MKRVVRCLSCEKVVGLYNSYKVRMQERIKTLLTGETKEIEIVGQICMPCAKIAGYSVGKKYGNSIGETSKADA